MRNSSVKLLPVLPDDKILRSLDDDNFLRTTIFSFPDFSITIVTFLFFFFFKISIRVSLDLDRFFSSRKRVFYFLFYSFLFFAIEQSEDKNYVDDRLLHSSFPLVIQLRVSKEARKMDTTNRFYGTRSLSPWQTIGLRAWQRLDRARIQTDVS